jgi:hypothetical protein
MTTAYKVLGQSNPTISTSNVIYQVPASRNAVVSTLAVCNIDNTPRSFRVAVQPNGRPLANANYISYDTWIPSNDTINLSIGMTLGSNDLVSVYANTNNLSFTLFGSEIY